jgi:hypothetical protein
VSKAPDPRAGKVGLCLKGSRIKESRPTNLSAVEIRFLLEDGPGELSLAPDPHAAKVGLCLEGGRIKQSVLLNLESIKNPGVQFMASV